MISVPVSVGELIDKLTILHIKKIKIDDEKKLEYVNNEFENLYNIASHYLDDEKIKEAYHKLVQINSTLWDVEDKLREYEKTKVFEGHFVSLARQVYITNDQRFEVKNFINEISGSELREQKSYEDYQSNEESENKEEWIYESPDGGKTVYRRPFGASHDKREILKNE
jgi:hypothetical protein